MKTVNACFIATAILILTGCFGGADEGLTGASNNKDTVYVRDTIYLPPSDPGAPTITSVVTWRGESQGGQERNYMTVYWTKVPNAIGYRVYYSMTVDGAYSQDVSGITEGERKWGIHFYAAGTYFFKVSSINNDGIEGPKSGHRAIVYDGL